VSFSITEGRHAGTACCDGWFGGTAPATMAWNAVAADRQKPANIIDVVAAPIDARDGPGQP
jgi:hypothetical protein